MKINLHTRASSILYYVFVNEILLKRFVCNFQIGSTSDKTPHKPRIWRIHTFNIRKLFIAASLKWKLTVLSHFQQTYYTICACLPNRARRTRGHYRTGLRKLMRGAQLSGRETVRKWWCHWFRLDRYTKLRKLSKFLFFKEL